jgi:hypothetical protein
VERAKAWFELSKSGLELAGRLGLVGILLLVVGCPETVKDRLREIGVTKLSTSGIEFDTALNDIATQNGDLRAENGLLRRDLAAAVARLREIESRLLASRPSQPNMAPPPDNPSVGASGSGAGGLQATIDGLSTILAATAKTQADRAPSPQVAQAVAQAQAAVGGVAGWAIIFSADTTEQAARNETRTVDGLKIGAPVLYLRQNMYRGALVFATQIEAQSRLGQVSAVGRHFSGAYVVNLTTWCPRIVSRPDAIRECATN